MPAMQLEVCGMAQKIGVGGWQWSLLEQQAPARGVKAALAVM